MLVPLVQTQIRYNFVNYQATTAHCSYFLQILHCNFIKAGIKFGDALHTPSTPIFLPC